MYWNYSFQPTSRTFQIKLRRPSIEKSVGCLSECDVTAFVMKIRRITLIVYHVTSLVGTGTQGEEVYEFPISIWRQLQGCNGCQMLFYLLKFIYSEKAKNFSEISTVDLTGTT